MKIVIFGLTITSSWGNGHATTYRSLCNALAARGHTILFVEKDVPWYRDNRDLLKPSFCDVVLYDDWSVSRDELIRLTADADAIVVGSYFPDAITATTDLLQAGRRPVLFYDIDTPVTVSQLIQHGGCEYLDRALIPKYAAYLSFSGGPILGELQTRFGAKRAIAFYCSVDPAIYRPMPVYPDYQCDLSYLGTYAADRQTKLMQLLNEPAQLLPSARFIVAGPQYPTTTKFQPNVQQISHLAPPQHPAFYSSSRFSLNLTREDMVRTGYSPSVRLFEASACGSAILSDDWAGLADFLTPGDEILLPQDAEDVVRMLLDVSDEERQRIGRRARERIFAEHTSSHRAAEFEQIISSL